MENFNFKTISCYLEEYFIEQGMNVVAASYLNLFINVAVIVLLVFLINFLIKRFVIETFKTFTNKTKTTFDDFLVKSKFPKYVGQIFPILLINYTAPYILINHQFLLKGTECYNAYLCNSSGYLDIKEFIKNHQELLKNPG